MVQWPSPTGPAPTSPRSVPSQGQAPIALSRGSTGPAVRDLQRKLRTLGYLSQDAWATGAGVFGPRTEEAVRAFQRRSGLKPSGAAGSATRAAVDSMIRQLERERSTFEPKDSRSAAERGKLG